MEFIIFLSKIDLEILKNIRMANYNIEENTPLCLIDKSYFGFLKKGTKTIVICTENAKLMGGYNFKKKNINEDQFKTKLYIRKALRHESTHVAQQCNNNKPLNIKGINNKEVTDTKKLALRNSLKFGGNRSKEIEAYILQDKPKLVLKAIKKYCL
tara:strand:- start:189 stop:653 length:465 start_codon:yes stop_codon:yes gene_type:complete